MTIYLIRIFSGQQWNDVYHYFAQIAFFFLEDLFEIDKDKFVVNISRHVDQLIMITPVDGSIISLKVKEKEAESKKGKNFSLEGDAQKDYNISNWESHKITSNDNHGSPIQIGESLWNYYLKTY